MSGLSAYGFERKRLVDIKSDIEDRLKLIFGENIDLTPQSGFGQFVGIESEAQSDMWETMEDIYNSQYPSTAQGNQLSNVVMYNGIERQEATNSTVTGTLSGTDGTVIPSGSQASVVATGDIFVTLESVTISGPVTVAMQSSETGAIDATAGTLTQIETPIFGWAGITNVSDATPGRSEETDAELRVRRVLSTQALGENLIDSLFGQLSNLDGVEDTIVKDNKTASVVDGIPAYQFLVSILGGENDEIAETIWKNTPQGIDSSGAVTVYHTDDQGFPQPVKFTRPGDIDVYFKMNITTDSDFPGSGVADIQAAVADYGASTFGISDDVIMSKFYTPINTIPGIISIELFIGITASPSGTSNLVIAVDEVSRYDAADVEVNIV